MENQKVIYQEFRVSISLFKKGKKMNKKEIKKLEQKRELVVTITTNLIVLYKLLDEDYELEAVYKKEVERILTELDNYYSHL
jgi:hypothetical protein